MVSLEALNTFEKDILNKNKQKNMFCLFHSGNPTCNMHPKKRNECGWPGIPKATCEGRGCCLHVADNSFLGVKWSFPEEITEGRN